MHFDFELKITIDTIIALFALLVALSSFIYTWSFNKFKISISDLDITTFDDEAFFAFSINNHSPKAVNILKVELISKNGKILLDTGFRPNMALFPDPYYISSPFTSNTVIFPNDSSNLSYYLKEYPAVIKIYSDSRIYNRKKYQSFVIPVDHTDESSDVKKQDQQ